MGDRRAWAAAARRAACLALAAAVGFAAVASLAACGGAPTGAGRDTSAGATTAGSAATTDATTAATTAATTTTAAAATSAATTTASTAATTASTAKATGEGGDVMVNENAGANPVATIEMADGGIIEVELYPDIAPNTVRNFISLANSGFYDGVIFHRVITRFMIQGGDPDGTGGGGPGYQIKGEFSNNGHANSLKHTRGVISMARQGNPFDPPAAYDTAGSQFFIMVANVPSLDGDYASFGKVTSGMDVADGIVSQPRDADDKPYEDQVIKSIRVETFGVDYGPPETLPE